MSLQILWFAIVSMFFTILFVLEGFDYGVGMLLPLLGKQDEERRSMLNAIGPFWLANEVWMICGGGALFAAFPRLYATLFSGFYPLMFLLLISLIARGAAIEFRSHHSPHSWRSFWDWIIFIGSLLPGFCWGLFIANLLEGVPVDAHMNYAGNILSILNPYAILWGLTFVALFLLHGAIFLTFRVNGELLARARRIAGQLWLPVIVLVLLLIGGSLIGTNLFSRMLFDARTAVPGTLALVALVAGGWFLRKQCYGRAFAMTCMTIILAAITISLGFFPHMMISSLNPAWSLTISSASSDAYTLTLISWFALPFLPFMLLSQLWNYWIFKKRQQEIGYY